MFKKNLENNVWIVFDGDSLTRNYAFYFLLKYSTDNKIQDFIHLQWNNLDFLLNDKFEIIYYHLQKKQNETRFENIIYNPNNININNYINENKDKFWIRQTVFL